MKLSIVIPVYNEERTIEQLLERVRNVDLPETEKEIIVVDDGSTDKTAEILRKQKGLQIIRAEKNSGKGASLKIGFEYATGDIVLIQDADLEYDPTDYGRLIHPIVSGNADVVFGSRFSGQEQRVFYFRHYVGNRFLTLLSNIFTNLNLSDMESGYKVFKKDVIKKIYPKLVSKRFGIEPELVARVAHGRWKVFEVPVNYYGRTYSEGKKIRWHDGINAVFAIIYFNVFNR